MTVAHLEARADDLYLAKYYWEATGDDRVLIQRLTEQLRMPGEKLAIALDMIRRHPKLIKREWVPSLLKVVEAGHPDLSRDAVEVLGMLGSDAQEAVPLLVDLLTFEALHDSRQYPTVRTAVWALGEIGNPAEPARKRLEALHSDGLVPWWDMMIDETIDRISKESDGKKREAEQVSATIHPTPRAAR